MATPTPTRIDKTTPRATATPLATIAIPLAAKPLVWRMAAPPAYDQSGYLPPTIAVAPSDGNTAYACSASTDDLDGLPPVQPHAWLTHDAAHTWAPVAVIPAHQQNNHCTVLIDPLDPAVAVALLQWAPRAGKCCNFEASANFVTFDSGSTWHELVTPQPTEMVQFATLRGIVYAVRAVLDLGNVVEYHLWASRDQMQTWQRVDQQINGDVQTFWLDSASGELLAEAGDFSAETGSGDVPTQLWHSLDGGQHWTQLLDRPIHLDVFQSPAVGQPWRACAASMRPDSTGALTNVLLCSIDGGQSWMERPGLNPTDPAQARANTFALAMDGAVLAEYGTGQVGTMYRLPDDSSQWEALGSLPVPYLSVLSYSERPGGGVIWTYSWAGLYIAAYP